MERKSEVIIVDSVMGSGKTTWAISHMNQNQEENVMYITPFLGETDRIKEGCREYREFQQPVNKGNGKLASLNDLLMAQEDIAATHELFRHLDENSKEYIRDGHYTLILDEVLNVIEPINVKPGDWKILRDKTVTVDEEGFVHWNMERIDIETDHDELRRMALNHTLMCVNDKLLLWRYPPEIFELFDRIYILTYLFEASILKNYFDLYKIEYIKKSVHLVDGEYILGDYFHVNPGQFANLINLYDGDLNYVFRQKNENALSSTWFESSLNNEKIKTIKNNIYNYLRNNLDAKAETIMWTCFKKAEKKLRGNGYTKRMVPFNCRSVNDYADSYNLVYAVNIFLHPAVTSFFAQRDIKVDQRLYALSEMVQWIWRSRIRKGETINIYIPSARMRGLLIDWLSDQFMDEVKAA